MTNIDRNPTAEIRISGKGDTPAAARDNAEAQLSGFTDVRIDSMRYRRRFVPGMVGATNSRWTWICEVTAMEMEPWA